MTDKVQKIKEWICKEQDGLMDAQGNFDNPSDEGAFHILTNLDYYIDSLREEPISESLNAESMIESYKQRLISQANGVKNSPLIDMCLASYKHGINETLDTLNLSNVQRTTKNWKEPVSEELEEAAKNHAVERFRTTRDKELAEKCKWSFKAGAKWQKKQCNNEANHALVEQIKTQQLCYEKGMADMKQQMMKNIWKPADGDDLPIFDREVIALLDNGKVVFSHRQNPNGWDGISVTTLNIEHYTPKTYGKCGWNVPDVKYWLDMDLPNTEK